MPQNLWSVVLAGGSGCRLANVTGGIPKQFWGVAGGRTMLEDTLERSANLAAPHQTVIVVDRTHAPLVSAIPRVARQHRVIYQPSDKGTAAGVLLGLTKVAAINPEAVVLLTPSDHGVRRPEVFAAGIRNAHSQVLADRSRVVLFGVPPTSADDDYGWITPADAAEPRAAFRPVAGFVEKPGPAAVRQLFESGAVWNTMVLVARVSVLLDLYRKQAPELLRAFLPLLQIDGPAHAAYLQTHYSGLPAADFSRDVIARSTDLTVYTFPVSIGWSDLGTPERLDRWAGEQIRERPLLIPAGPPAPPSGNFHYAN